MTQNQKLTALILFTLSVVTLLIYFRFSQDTERLIAAPVPLTESGDLIPVEIFKAKAKPLANKIFTTGTLLASEEASLFSETSGKVTDIYFKEGEYVTKNTLLIKLNDNDLIAQLDRIGLEKTFAETTLRRQKQLFEKGGISREQFDLAKNKVQVLQAQMNETRARIEKTEVRAPFDGIIGLRQISNGAYLNPGTLTANIQNLDDLNIEFSIPEKYFRSVNVNDEIEFKVSGIESYFKAVIYAIEPQIDVNTRTVIMRAKFDNRTAKLLPGLFAYIEYKLETIKNAILIPSQSIVPELKGQKVFILKNGLVTQSSVDTGIRTDTEVQILSGVSPGDSIITTGILQIRPGMPVQVKY
jgi:membrane fusion protein (multidrug efflux system)